MTGPAFISGKLRGKRCVYTTGKLAEGLLFPDQAITVTDLSAVLAQDSTHFRGRPGKAGAIKDLGRPGIKRQVVLDLVALIHLQLPMPTSGADREVLGRS